MIFFFIVNNSDDENDQINPIIYEKLPADEDGYDTDHSDKCINCCVCFLKIVNLIFFFFMF